MSRSASGRAPEGLGPAYEAQLDAESRRATGAFYTPDHIADGLVRLALDGLDSSGRPPRICDPAVGGGAFLLAAARHLEAEGLDRRTIVEECLHGCDTDGAAVAVTCEALRLWADDGGAGVEVGPHVVIADGLLERPWSGSFDAVVGNPPFLNQLETRTVRARDEVALLRSRFGESLAAYADSSTLFVLAAVDLCRPGGRVGMILPESFLSVRDAEPTRRRLRELARLEGVWLANDAVFEASVRVCAPVVTVGRAARQTVERWQGAGFENIGPIASGDLDRSWSPLLADLVGPPQCHSETDGRLGDLATATAGFRDQFYGIRDFVGESSEADRVDGRFARLVTSGLIDPAVCLWGHRPTRFAGRRFMRPRVDLDALERADSKLAAWARERLVPKVVLATQTRVLEAAVDVDGSWYPSTPTIAVHCAPVDLWRVAAVLLAPPVTSWAYRRAAGNALAREAVKLSASQALEIPLPREASAWADAASLLEVLSTTPIEGDRLPAFRRFGAAMSRAYGVEDAALLRWWCERLPARSL